MTHTYSESELKALKLQLKDIINNEPASIRAYVAQEALDHSDDVIQLFLDLRNGGCICGTVRSLIYYADTHKFFDTYYDEVDEIREEYEESMGEPLRIDGDLKNWLAWFAFEYIADQIAFELGLDF